MTKVVASQPIDMTNSAIFFGTVSSFSSTQITIVAGSYMAQYLGNFTYDTFGNVFGQLTGYVFKISGAVQYSVSEMNTDAYLAFVDIQSGNIAALYARALNGADSFSGSNLADKLQGFAGRDVMNGNGGDDVLYGGLDIDRLNGGLGRDLLIAGDGADLLIGGQGSDSLEGGAGNDKFVFNTALSNSNRDRIIDFIPGHDKMLLENTGVGMFNGIATGVLAATRFKDIANGAVDANDRILYDPRNGTLYFDRDGSASAAPVAFAILQNLAVITTADFTVI